MSSTRGCGFFVTGTDTGIGKTEVACALIGALECAGWSCVGMKPVAAGARRVGSVLKNADVERLDRASSVRAPRALRNPYVLAPAIAPHIAAAEAGIDLDPAIIVQAYRQLAKRAEIIIVEGAGGLRVPLGKRFDMSELARRLRLPVVVVVGMRLGCISHALLTVEAIERRGLALAGWIANRVDPRMHRYSENLRTLQSSIDAPMLADVPYVENAMLRSRVLRERIDLVALGNWLPQRRST